MSMSTKDCLDLTIPVVGLIYWNLPWYTLFLIVIAFHITWTMFVPASAVKKDAKESA